MSPAPAEKKSVYTGELPSTEDLLDEQYAWLRVHSEMCKVKMAGACEHCWRMKKLHDILMQPFREEKYYAIQISKRKANPSKADRGGAVK